MEEATTAMRDVDDAMKRMEDERLVDDGDDPEFVQQQISVDADEGTSAQLEVHIAECVQVRSAGKCGL